MSRSIVFPTILLVLLFKLIPINAQVQNEFSKSTVLQKLVDENKVVGLSAGYLINGKTTWMSTSGYADLENKTPFTPQTKTRTASIGKSMTAIAIVQLQEQGKLNFDDPVKKHLPYFPSHKKGTITIRHLLNHSSGIGAYQNQEFNSLTEYKTLKEAIAVFQNRELEHKPGVAYRYTTYGYVILGAVIESVSGKSFEEYLQDHIWTPIGMKNTGIEKYSKKYTNKAKLYKRTQEGQLKSQIQNNLSNRVPGGGFYSTVEDLLKFGEAILNNNLVTKESFEEMIKDPGIKKQGSGYGLGWYLYGTNRKGENVIGHSGSQQGAATQLFIWPDAKRVVIAMTNTDGAYSDIFNCADQIGGKATEAESRETSQKRNE